jgi:hypothetical protein
MSQSSKLLVAAIDFGTTYSGYALVAKGTFSGLPSMSFIYRLNCKCVYFIPIVHVASF